MELVVTGPKRTPMLPKVPTLGESGYPGFEPLGWAGVLVHGGTPKPLVEAIARDVIRATRHPDNLAKFAEQTLEDVVVGPTNARGDLQALERFEVLDAINASELIRDLEGLRP